jgi:hypothetical protein
MNIYKSSVFFGSNNQTVFRLPFLNLETLTHFPHPTLETLFPVPSSALAMKIICKEC